jgi:hypothetical protein
MDQLLYVWASVMLRLDAAFHSLVTIAHKRVTCSTVSAKPEALRIGSIDEALAGIGLQVRVGCQIFA